MAAEFRFYGHYPRQPGWMFSNFSDHPTLIDGHLWKTTEHYFQAMKFFGSDDAWYNTIKNVDSVAASKKLGNSRDHKLRDDWENVKDDVMRKAVKAKVYQHLDVFNFLMSTGNQVLIEASPTDYYWGEGDLRTGKNMLGKILMEIRKDIKDTQQVNSFPINM